MLLIIPNSLQKFTNGMDEVIVEAASLAELFIFITSQFPDLQSHLFDKNSQLKNFFNVYVDGEDSRYLNGLDTSLTNVKEVVIVAAVAGG